MTTAHYTRRRPGRTAAKNLTNSGHTINDHKVSNFADAAQLSLFDTPLPVTSPMDAFFASLRPHLGDLRPTDRLSVIAGAYWLQAGEDAESIAALLRAPLRAVFRQIIEKL